MPVIHISEAEAARDFSGVLAQVRAGAEIVIESGDRPVAVIKPAPMDASLSATIARLDASSEALGYVPVMDAEFAADMEDIIRNRKPADRSAWD